MRPCHPITMLLAVSLVLAGCSGAPAPPATPPPAVEEYKYNELPAECFPGYRHLVDEFTRPMINQLDDVRVTASSTAAQSAPMREPPGSTTAPANPFAWAMPWFGTATCG